MGKGGCKAPEEPHSGGRKLRGDCGRKKGAEAALHRPQCRPCCAKDAAQDGHLGRPWMRADSEAPAGQGCRNAGGGELANAAAECNARMQRHSRGRSVGMEARRRSTTWCCRQAEIGARGGDLWRARGGRSGEAPGGGDAARNRHWSGRNVGDVAPRTQSTMETAAGQECNVRRRTQRTTMREPSS